MKKIPFLIGKPRNHPTQLANALVALFEQHREVHMAYLAQIFDIATGNLPHITIGIIMDKPINIVANDLQKIIKTQFSGNPPEK